MRYTLKERVFSLRDSYYIRDGNGNDAFEVAGRLIGFRDKLYLRDLNGNNVATIAEQRISLRPVYNIRRDNGPDAKIKKDFINIMRDGFTVDIDSGEPDLRIKGNILEHSYTITRQGKEIAQASKKWISLRDSYIIDIADGEDVPLLLSCALIVDRIVHDGDGDK